MKATQGRIVIVTGINSNGSLEHPAVITRPWSEEDVGGKPQLANVTVFPDCSAPVPQGSVPLFDTRENALAYFGGDFGQQLAAWFPARA